MFYAQFQKQLAHLELTPIYLLLGSEIYLKERFIAELKNKLSVHSHEDLNYFTFYSPSSPARDVIDQALTISFLAQKSLIVLYEVDKYLMSDLNIIEKYIKNPNSSTVLVMTAEKIDKRKSFYRSISKCDGAVFEFPGLYEKDVKDWIRNIAKEKGKLIAPAAVENLYENAGNNLSKIAMEIEKLACLVGEEKKIDQAHTRLIVGRTRSETAFDLCDAIGSRNTGKALEILKDRIEEGEKTEALIWIIRWQVMRLWKGKELLQRGESASSICSKFKIPVYFQQKFINMTKNFTLDSLKKSLLLIFQADVKLRSSRLNRQNILETLLISLGSV